MRSNRFYLKKSKHWQAKSLQWLSKHFEYVFAFKGNNYSDGFETIFYASNSVFFVKELADLGEYPINKNYCFALSYDLKNKIENLESTSKDIFELPDITLLKAEVKLSFQGNHVLLSSKTKRTKVIFDAISDFSFKYFKEHSPIFTPNVNQKEYLETFEKIKEHIVNGDIYEMCYCMDYSDSCYLLKNPAGLYLKLCKVNPKPFSSFVKLKDYYLISASPERYLKVDGQRIISQPIKGTSARSSNNERDAELRLSLKNSSKEQSENLMIVDLVRNDLAKISQAGSVKVDELFGIYTFPDIHQMISTVSGTLKEDATFPEIIKATFPMGSMTGAPKIKAMELIDYYERFKRSWYSGSIGYFTSTGFDSNVVIRSLQYHQDKKILSYHVGSAITYESEAIKEFEECLSKGKSLNKLFNH